MLGGLIPTHPWVSLRRIFLISCDPCLPLYARHMGILPFNSLLWASVSSRELVCPTPTSESQPKQASQWPMVGKALSQRTFFWTPKCWSCPHFGSPWPMSSCQPEHLLYSTLRVPFRTELPKDRIVPTHFRDLSTNTRVA